MEIYARHTLVTKQVISSSKAKTKKKYKIGMNMNELDYGRIC